MLQSGAVRRIVHDLLATGYDGAFSIEPHMVVVFHDAASQADEGAQFENFVEYGRRLEKLIGGIKVEMSSTQKPFTAGLSGVR